MNKLLASVMCDHHLLYSLSHSFMLSQVFLSLSFDEDLGRTKMANADAKFKNKKNKKRKNFKESSQLQENDKKKSRQELMSKTRNEVLAPSEEILAS